MKMKDVLVHTNRWYWGVSETIIIHGGAGVVEIQYDKYTNTAYVKGLSVAKMYRNNGLGTVLMSLCEDRARKKGRVFMQLCCHKGKDWLYEWYKKLGYETFSWDDKEFVMVKKI